MKIASYNIMSGGFNNYNSASNKPERLHLIQKAIETIKPDFIGLIDTFRWVEIFTDKELQKLFNFKYSFHINLDDVRVDKRVGITVLSNLPIKKISNCRFTNKKMCQS